MRFEMVVLRCSAFLALNIVCGATANQPKIINGIESDRFQFPYYVFIRCIFGNMAADCGGTIISDRWIITAAHCLESRGNMLIYFGSVGSKFAHVEKVSSSAQYIHPYYGKVVGSNDIALISLPRKIPSNQAIRPVKLSQNCGEDLDEKDAITAGKGGEGIDSPVRYAILKIRPRKWCRKVLLKTTNIKPNSVICAYSVFGQTIFNGDSGGPLIRDSDGSLIGITSFTQGFDFNQAFTNVHYHNDWIGKVTGLPLPNCTHLNSARLSTPSVLMTIICIVTVLVLYTQ